MNAFFDEVLETMPLPALRAQQLAGVNRWLGKHRAGLQPLQDLKELDGLPCMTAADLSHTVDTAPFSAAFCSSGTTGAPKSLRYSANDLANAYLRTARTLVACGVTPTDRVALIVAFNAWLVGHDFMQAAARVGCQAIPLGENSTDHYRARVIEDLRASVIVSTPWVIARLSSFLAAHDTPPARLAVRRLILTGEPLIANMRSHLERLWEAEVFTIYGSSEADTMGAECSSHRGVHLWEDCILPEIEPIAEVEQDKNVVGELIITMPTREAMPFLRYRTGDLVEALPGSCPCGRTHQRVQVLGRLAEGVRFGTGQVLFPHRFEQELSAAPAVIAYQLTIAAAHTNRPEFNLRLVLDRPQLRNSELERLREAVMGGLEGVAPAGLSLTIETCAITSVQRGISGKVKRFVVAQGA